MPCPRHHGNYRPLPFFSLLSFLRRRSLRRADTTFLAFSCALLKAITSFHHFHHNPITSFRRSAFVPFFRNFCTAVLNFSKVLPFSPRAAEILSSMVPGQWMSMYVTGRFCPMRWMRSSAWRRSGVSVKHCVRRLCERQPVPSGTLRCHQEARSAAKPFQLSCARCFSGEPPWNRAAASFPYSLSSAPTIWSRQYRNFDQIFPEGSGPGMSRITVVRASSQMSMGA